MARRRPMDMRGPVQFKEHNMRGKPQPPPLPPPPEQGLTVPAPVAVQPDFAVPGGEPIVMRRPPVG